VSVHGELFFSAAWEGVAEALAEVSRKGDFFDAAMNARFFEGFKSGSLSVG
jgi:hypothetical protein